MDRMTSKVFGELDPDQPDPTADIIGPHGEDLMVTLDLTDHAHFTQEALDRAERQLNDLQTRDRRIRDFLLTDAQDGRSATSLYLSHHLDELKPQNLTATFGLIDAQPPEPRRFIERLRIRHISLHPAENGPTLVLDYGFDPGITDYILAVETDETGAVESVEMES